MAAPNIFNPTTCTLSNAFLALTTSAAAIVSNASSSGTVVRIVSLMVSNVTSSLVTVTADVYSGGTVQANLACGLSVPVGATIVLLSKDSPLHLTEGQSLRLTASANNSLQAVANHEVIS